MKIVIAPDSFKHSMSAAEVCEICKQAVADCLPDAEAVSIPVADGGEGTIGAMLAALGGTKVRHRVAGPEFAEAESYYGLVDDHIAVIEMALICGLTMVSTPNPEETTTYGVGQMIKKALDDGCDKIILCIGGSATNDAGIGALAALGASFRDAGGKEVVPKGGNLSRINSIDTENLDKRLATAEILIACDVDNPLYGENGAAHVFAPQKGAGADMVRRLDDGLRHYAEILRQKTGKDISQIPGTGAAGGIAAGFTAFASPALRPGADIVLDAYDFDRRISGADLVITGEGKTDRQTLSGKAVLGVARRAKRLGVPVIVISGAVEGEVDGPLYDEGVLAVFPTVRQTRRFDEIQADCPEWLRLTVKNVIRTYFR
ncbi:MAG: glycerate kinase [Defluviitaleaceae bacterium]|nr:glycerate kinase [Defluviitaleaceae bacterium]